MPLGPPRHLLGTWRATAICGNDITSSCLYVGALATMYAGPLAPVALLLVAAVLYLFRFIYAEVGSALPLNGGAYNVLLNAASKRVATVAGVLTVLSYMATAVISASEAMHYLATLVPELPVVAATATVLTCFALLTWVGLTESATVALGIFVLHLSTLVVLCLTGLAAVWQDPSIGWANLAVPMASWPMPSSSVGLALLFGFSAAMLGVSGFESSANYIEEQAPGVFPKTLRNMWIAVAVFNPLIAALILGVVPMGELIDNKEALLVVLAEDAAAQAGLLAAVGPMGAWMAVDAVLVLCGAVLTAYVGAMGLIRRLAMDLVLPPMLLRRNHMRGTPHWIIGGFLALCLSVLTITGGEIERLASVYTLSFLSVMALFAAGNLWLKARRPQLRRASRAHPTVVRVALAAVVVALVGNIALEPDGVRTFGVYVMVFGGVAGLMYVRTPLMAAFLHRSQTWVLRVPYLGPAAHRRASAWLHDLTCRRLLFVAVEADQAELERLVSYVEANEPIRHVDVLLASTQDGPSEARVQAVARVDRAHPAIRLGVVALMGEVTPARLLGLAEARGIPPHHVLLRGDAVLDASEVPGARLVF